VQTFCVRNTPDTIGFVRDLGGLTTTMKRRLLYQIDSKFFRFLIKKKIARANYVKDLIFTRLQRQCGNANVFH
jgi:hypothetical protein